MLLNILSVGDVVGEGGLDILSRRLDGLRQETQANFVVVNGENASGVGITPAQARRILEAGADVITLGNHTWNRLQIGDYLDKEARILRPANYAGRVPGRGMGIYPCKGLRIAVLNLMGRAELNSNLDNPFKMANSLLRSGGFDLALVDFHAEATGEKRALGFYADGRVTALFGTHTHVPTADGCLLPHHTGYLTDAGMTGPIDSVLGVKPEIIIGKLKTKMPARFEWAKGPCKMDCVLFTAEERTGLCTGVERLSIT